MAYTGSKAVDRPIYGPPTAEEYPEDGFFDESSGKKGKGKSDKDKKKGAKAKDKERTKALSKKNKGYDSNSKEWRRNVKIEDDQYVPERRVNPKDKDRLKEKGLVIRYPDMVKATKVDKDGNKGACYGIDINSRRGQKKCVQKMRAEYKKEHAVVYTSACAGVTGYFARKRCIKKYNRGL